MEKLGIIGGFIFMVAFWAFAIAQIFAGYIGIEYYFSAFWAWIALIVAVFFRFMLPLTVGSFFAALNVWEWHWALAACFAVPGLLFAIPGLLAVMISSVKRKLIV